MARSERKRGHWFRPKGPNAVSVATVLALNGAMARWPNGKWYVLTSGGTPSEIRRNVATWLTAHQYVRCEQTTVIVGAELTFVLTERGKQWLRQRLEQMERQNHSH